MKTYYIDTYSANKMGMEQTIGSPSILTMRNGDKDLDGLIASIDKGILVTGFTVETAIARPAISRMVWKVS